MSRNGKNYVSGWIRKEKRQKIYTRDNHTCLYCGDSIYDTAGLVLTLDHVVAKKLFLQDRGIDTTKIEKNVKNALRRKLK